jgi:hypothetical protein
MVMCNALGLVL